jgi:hypothetical protein
MEHTIAFLAGGALHVLTPEGAARRIESPFAEEVQTRSREIHHRHAWKAEGRGAMFMSRGLLWGGPGRDPGASPVTLTSLTRGPKPGELLYAMAVEGRTAICKLRLEGDVERRLLHGSEYQILDLAASPGGDDVACSLAQRDGTACLALMTGEATDLREVTQGEARDTAPAWVAGRRLVYESAGVGRDSAGRPAGLGRSAIHTLDLDQGSVLETASDPKRDLIRPRGAADGTLYYLSRPYRGSDHRAAWRVLLDLVLLPLRLLYAVFQYLSFFTARYTGRPLTTAGGPKRQGADARQMQVWSNLAEAEESAGESGADRPAVPRSWQLMRRSPDGSTVTLAQAVLAYDVTDAGVVAYTTGASIYLLNPDGVRRKLLSSPAISQVVFAD